VKFKTLSLFAVICALGVAIPMVAFASTPKTPSTGYATDYCTQYSPQYASEYCTTSTTTPPPTTTTTTTPPPPPPKQIIPGVVPGPITSTTQAIQDTLKAIVDSATVTGLSSGSPSVTVNGATLLTDLKKLEAAAVPGSPAAKAFAAEVAVLSTPDTAITASFPAGFTFIPGHVRHDVFVYGKPSGRSGKAAKLVKLAYTYKVKGGKLSIKLNKPATDIKVEVKKGALKATKKASAAAKKAKTLNYKLGLTDTKHKSATFSA